VNWLLFQRVDGFRSAVCHAIIQVLDEAKIEKLARRYARLGTLKIGAFPAEVALAISPLTTLDLTMTRLRRSSTNLRHALECDSLPYAPRLDPRKAILAMLEPRCLTPSPYRR